MIGVEVLGKESDVITKFRARMILLLGAYTALWGLWIINPFWRVFGTAHLYDSMQEFMSETLWGFNAILAGSIMIFGWIRKSLVALVWGSVAGVYHWGVIGFLYFLGDWQNTGGITSIALALIAAGIYVNEKDEEQTFDDTPYHV